MAIECIVVLRQLKKNSRMLSADCLDCRWLQPDKKVSLLRLPSCRQAIVGPCRCRRESLPEDGPLAAQGAKGTVPVGQRNQRNVNVALEPHCPRKAAIRCYVVLNEGASSYGGDVRSPIARVRPMHPTRTSRVRAP